MIKLLDFWEMKDVMIEGIYEGYMIKASLVDSVLNIKYNKYFMSKSKFKEYLLERKVFIDK